MAKVPCTIAAYTQQICWAPPRHRPAAEGPLQPGRAENLRKTIGGSGKREGGKEGIQTTRDSEEGIQDKGFKTRHSRQGIQKKGFKIRDSAEGIQDKDSEEGRAAEGPLRQFLRPGKNPLCFTYLGNKYNHTCII